MDKNRSYRIVGCWHGFLIGIIVTMGLLMAIIVMSGCSSASKYETINKGHRPHIEQLP